MVTLQVLAINAGDPALGNFSRCHPPGIDVLWVHPKPELQTKVVDPVRKVPDAVGKLHAALHVASEARPPVVCGGDDGPSLVPGRVDGEDVEPHPGGEFGILQIQPLRGVVRVSHVVGELGVESGQGRQNMLLQEVPEAVDGFVEISLSTVDKDVRVPGAQCDAAVNLEEALFPAD
ncbi:MAG: hypothetical protein JW394_0177 [Nitrospira sp.]|nr:hypothetical protein [Nitrospira sp.]